MHDTSTLLPPAVLAALIKAARTTPPGCWVEVGVYRGGSALPLYRVLGERTLHLFDTFTGLPVSDPAKGDSHVIGAFAAGPVVDHLREIMPLAHLHVGSFPDTLPSDLCNIAFAHVDVDQYQCTLDCITHLWPRMVAGGVMWFDDIELAGARRAVGEHFHNDQLQGAPEGRRFVIKWKNCGALYWLSPTL